MNTIQRDVKTAGHVLLLLSIFWAVFMLITMQQIKPGWGLANFIRWSAKADIFYVIGYANAAVMTVLTVVLFAALFNFVRAHSTGAAFMGLLFVPIYGLLNIVCYSLQITFVPALARKALISGDSHLAGQLIQAYGASMMSYLNVLAYAMIGIPSVIYGILMIKEKKIFSGILLTLSGLLFMTGFVGMLLKHKLVAMGTSAGSLAFVVCLVLIVIEFKGEQA